METDDEVLSRSARDPAAFEPLVTRLSSELHGYLSRRAPEAADDLLAEVWLQAYASRTGFDRARGSARAWLYGVAHNVLRAHWRRLRARDDRPVAEVWDEWAAVDARLDSAAVAPALRAALESLPPAERELLLLTAWEQLSPTEAAAVVGIPPATARTRLHRARRRLREDLQRNPRVVVPPSTVPTGDLP